MKSLICAHLERGRAERSPTRDGLRYGQAKPLKHTNKSLRIERDPSNSAERTTGQKNYYLTGLIVIGYNKTIAKHIDNLSFYHFSFKGIEVSAGNTQDFC